jgi:DNA replication and repair protein RecF
MLESGPKTLQNAMQVKTVTLSNFRNYPDVNVSVGSGKTFLIGENAQGKSNFLEAVELVSTGRSARASQDSELIRWGEPQLSVQVIFERMGVEESVEYRLARQTAARPGQRLLSRQILVNGVSYSFVKALLGHLITVSFQVDDLNLLRGGPKYRRDWIDGVILRVRPTFLDVLQSFAKVISQRNRLLKTICEAKRVTVSDQDQLLAWDKQLARFGSQIIKERMRLLSELLPRAQENQSHLSGRRESLQADYYFKAPEPKEDDSREYGNGVAEDLPPASSMSALLEAEEQEVAQILMRLLKERRREEIARKQSLVGPHRDDISLTLNDSSAVTFASQGQQRSLVLSLKLAELERLTESCGESPVLLLDDVMAELDAGRQRLLMSAVGDNTQTIITTTHLAGFEPSWLEGATIYSVAAGAIEKVTL